MRECGTALHRLFDHPLYTVKSQTSYVAEQEKESEVDTESTAEPGSVGEENVFPLVAEVEESVLEVQTPAQSPGDQYIACEVR